MPPKMEPADVLNLAVLMKATDMTDEIAEFIRNNVHSVKRPAQGSRDHWKYAIKCGVCSPDSKIITGHKHVCFFEMFRCYCYY